MSVQKMLNVTGPKNTVNYRGFCRLVVGGALALVEGLGFGVWGWGRHWLSGGVGIGGWWCVGSGGGFGVWGLGLVGRHWLSGAWCCVQCCPRLRRCWPILGLRCPA